MAIVYDWTPALAVDEANDDSDKTFTVSASQAWQPISIWVELTTTSTVGNRQMCVEFQDADSDVIAQVVAGAVQAASLSYRYLFAIGAADLSTARDTTYLSTPLPPMILPPGYKIRVYDKAAVAAAADDMNVQMLYEHRSA